MIDVASALEYLHRSYSIPVVHCDLNPNNVLLNEDMVACVTNFGVPKILSILHQYGLEGLVSTGSGIYSYGSMLIEVFARLKPIDEMFSDTCLRNWLEGITSMVRIAIACTEDSPRDSHVLRGNLENCLPKIRKFIS
ncbi:unnamed protein product [Coffea canephora]|uniref:DH200=94 genomic scaffold, scaffold_2119 n=1 Tax=Coffea canephora TaxID=49390 RepID=A0A068VJE2_COFCA|nr:unnamed protein product [Coffea canephora]